MTRRRNLIFLSVALLTLAVLGSSFALWMRASGYARLSLKAADPKSPSVWGWDSPILFQYAKSGELPPGRGAKHVRHWLDEKKQTWFVVVKDNEGREYLYTTSPYRNFKKKAIYGVFYVPWEKEFRMSYRGSSLHFGSWMVVFDPNVDIRQEIGRVR